MFKSALGLVGRFVASGVFAAALMQAHAVAQLQVMTVPWKGDPNLAHQVNNGGTLVLQGVAVEAVGCPLSSATWDPGDGSAPIVVSVANPRILEATHTYTGVNNQPFVATLSVTDSCGTTVVDQFRIQIVDPIGLDVEVNMAIDKGLWNLHKRIILSSVGSVPTGFWNAQNTAAATSSALQALQIHGHLANGNGAEDPYVDDVQRGLAHIMTEIVSSPIGVQTAGDPDTNGNGIGLYVPSAPIYGSGQVIDAIVASGTPSAVAVTGPSPDVLGRTYGDIVQDLLDMYAWGQADAVSGGYRGGWRYGYNSDADNSACQWMAIGGIAAERVFGSTVPQFVKDENLNFWLAFSQFRDGTYTSWDGSLGYVGQISIVDVLMMNTTPSGIVQLVLDGVPSSDARFDAAQAYMARNWTQLTLNNRIYGMFATAKAMRLALPAPVHVLSSPGGPTFDWYRAQTSLGDPVDGVARRLVSIQQGDGSWDGYWVIDDLATAWSVIILSSTIVQVGPVAVCEADPELTAATFPVDFDGSGSHHPDPNHQIVNYEWDFEGDGIYDATGVHVVHAYAAQGTYNATLRVTDDTTPVALQSTSVCQIQITPPPFPPDSDPGGPYDFCPQNQPWILDGTGSSDPDGSIVNYEWDFNPQPLDLSFNDANGPTVDVTAFFSTLPPGVYDVALRVTDDLTNTNVDFTTVRVLTGNDPSCVVGPPVITCPPNFVEIYAGGIPAGQCDPSHTGTATYTDNCTTNVQLSYQDISIVPNTIQNPGAPEVVVTRRWTVTDGCGGSDFCDQTITLLSPGGQTGALMLDVKPNVCPNDVGPGTGMVSITIPGTWTHDAAQIDPTTLRLRRADGVGKALKFGPHLNGPSFQDVTRPYYGQNGPCASQNGEGRSDFTVFASSRALRTLLKLHTLPDNTQVTLILTGKLTTGEPFSVTDWIYARK